MKVEVTDGHNEASFVMFDMDCHYIVKKSCKELVAASKVVVGFAVNYAHVLIGY